MTIRHELESGETVCTLYAHLSQNKVSQGQMVLQGEMIGVEGGSSGIDPNPGESTGHHLHFTVMDWNMKYIDPFLFLLLYFF